MAMTREERATQLDLANRLGEQGYATYAKLFMLFDLRLTSDPRFIGFMEPDKGRITLNRTLDAHQMLLTIRHEILHEYLTHELRLLEHLAEKNPNLDGDEVSLKEILYKDDVFNIAADYEISNRGYTEQDKKDIKNIKFNGQIVSGLVTEDKHPDWTDLSVEEMYDLLRDERDKAKQEAQKDLEDNEESENNSNDSQSQDSGEGSSGESDDEEQGESGDNEGSSQDGEDQAGDSQEDGSDENSSGQSNDSQGDSSDDAQDGDQGSNGSSKDNSDQGTDSNEQDSNNSSGESSDNQSKGNSQSNSNGSQSSSQNRSSQNDLQVVRGTFRDGKFYDLNGNEINPGA